MKILVTGGCGFIGSHFIRYSLDIGDSIINLDKLTYASNNSLDSKEICDSSRYMFFPLDICQQEALENIIKRLKPDTIVHFAAESHVDNSIESPDNFIHSNIVGTYSLLEAIRHTNKDIKLLHISTDEVYGSISNGFFNEYSPYNPGSPYSATKASSDTLVKAWGNTYDIPFIITHCTNNYGPWQHEEKLIPLMIKRGSQKKHMPIYGKGLNKRDWIYVTDHVKALRLLLDKGSLGVTYNIAALCEKTNVQVVNDICSTLDEILPEQAPHSQYITYVTDRLGHDFRYGIDPQRLLNLDWQPKVTWKEGLIRTIKWYLRV